MKPKIPQLILSLILLLNIKDVFSLDLSMLLGSVKSLEIRSVKRNTESNEYYWIEKYEYDRDGNIIFRKYEDEDLMYHIIITRFYLENRIVKEKETYSDGGSLDVEYLYTTSNELYRKIEISRQGEKVHSTTIHEFDIITKRRIKTSVLDEFGKIKYTVEYEYGNNVTQSIFTNMMDVALIIFYMMKTVEYL